ncbi:hypothetical protein PMG71_13025 [Roseofilum sp. BLCC_M154]|uniref:Uncharacterized protein n=1 Tax=Roseofilum acuticapitatum BLCC-M154 TaxID=3022444 RepID=A0ABT7ATY2_9CYAN|nr:hypothetical protein [Roseofilum acuticapitatum]MDJ1170355.1 hypothetical protein [Roseofilum acuticapitatum BLCC-M154]
MALSPAGDDSSLSSAQFSIFNILEQILPEWDHPHKASLEI